MRHRAAVGSAIGGVASGTAWSPAVVGTDLRRLVERCDVVASHLHGAVPAAVVKLQPARERQAVGRPGQRRVRTHPARELGRRGADCKQRALARVVAIPPRDASFSRRVRQLRMKRAVAPRGSEICGSIHETALVVGVKVARVRSAPRKADGSRIEQQPRRTVGIPFEQLDNLALRGCRDAGILAFGRRRGPSGGAPIGSSACRYFRYSGPPTDD